jgi:hypothetical protein
LIEIAEGRILQNSEQQVFVAVLALYSLESNINWWTLEYTT